MAEDFLQDPQVRGWLDGVEPAWFVEPTIFAGVNNQMRIAREEVFGPVLSVIPFDDEDDAIEIGNHSSSIKIAA